MKTWIALFLLAPLAACSSKNSNPDSDCCITAADPDAGLGPTCWCPLTETNASISATVKTTVTGSTCTVTIVETSNGSTLNTTVAGTVPTSESQCAADLPFGG